MTDDASLWTSARIVGRARGVLAGVAVSIAGEDAAVTPFAASARRRLEFQAQGGRRRGRLRAGRG